VTGEAKVLTGGLGGEHGGLLVPRRAPAPLLRRRAAHRSYAARDGWILTGAGGWVDLARQEEPSCLQALTGADSSRCRVGGNTSRNAHDYGGEEATDLRRDRRRLPAEARRAAVLRALLGSEIFEPARFRPSASTTFVCLSLGWTPRGLVA
jgi:hypothetical protein